MQEHRIHVTRSARYYTLGTPGPDTREIWIVLHGFGQLASRFLRRFEVAAAPTRLIVAPEALNRFYLDTSPRPHGADAIVGATWMTREDRENEIADYVNYLDAVLTEVVAQLPAPMPRGNPANAATLLLLGFSQGVATLCRWVSLGRVRADRIVLWSGTLPADVDLTATAGRWKAQPLSIVWGRKDAAAHADAIGSDRLRLGQAGLEVEWLEFEGGHAIDPATVMQLTAIR